MFHINTETLFQARERKEETEPRLLSEMLTVAIKGCLLSLKNITDRETDKVPEKRRKAPARAIRPPTNPFKERRGAESPVQL